MALVIGCTPSRPGTRTRACSPASPPATRSSSSRTRARCCRWRSPCRYAREVLAEAGFDPNLVQLAAENPARRSRPPWPPARRSRSSTSPGPASSATGWRRTPGRPWSTPRRPGSTRSWWTPPTTSPGCAATSAFSLSPLQRADVHHAAEHPGAARRASRPTRATSPSTSSRPGSRRRSRSCPAADPARAVELTRRDRQRGVLRRLEEAPGAGRGRARLGGADPPDLPGRDGAHAALVLKLAADRTDTYGPGSGSGRSRSSSSPTPPSTAWRCSGGRWGDHGALTAAGVLHRREGAGGGRARRPWTWGCTCRATSPAACSSTRPRRSPISTPPAPTRPRTRRCVDGAYVASRFRIVESRRHA